MSPFADVAPPEWRPRWRRWWTAHRSVAARLGGRGSKPPRTARGNATSAGAPAPRAARSYLRRIASTQTAHRTQAQQSISLSLPAVPFRALSDPRF